jgi:hypothetical protein
MIVLDLSILNQKGTPMFNSDIFANRPAFGIVGRIFISIDTAAIYRDTGSASTNIYNSNGTLTGNRVLSDGGFGLSFTPTTHIGSAAIGGGGSGKLIVGSSTADNGIQVFGANSPSLRIDNAQSGGTQRFVFGLATATNNFIQGATAGQFCISTQSSGAMLFGMWQSVNATEAMRISTANNLIVGSSVDNGNRLQVTGTAYISGNLGLGTTNAQFPLEIVTPNANPIAIVSTRENANGPSYFVGRCIGGTIASPTDQVGQGAIFQSYGYRGGAYREHGYLIFNGVNATSGGGIAGSLNLFLSNDSTSNTQIASATATSFNIGGDYTQTTYKFKVSGISQFSNGAASLTANILNTTTAASGVTGYGLAIESEATAASSYNLICRNIDGSNVYGGISTATSQVGFWSIGFAPTGTIGNRLSVSGAMSVGSGSYLTTAAPSNGAMIEGTVLIGTNTNSGEKLVVNGTVRTTNTITIDDTSFPRLALKRSTSSSQADIAFIDGANIKWSIGQAVISVGNNLDFYAYATSRGILVLKESGVVNMPNLPTSSAGLVSGDIYNNLGILTIV